MLVFSDVVILNNVCLFQRCLSEFATGGMVSAKNIKVIPFYMLSKLVFLSYVAVYMLHGVLHVLLKLYVAIPED